MWGVWRFVIPILMLVTAGCKVSKIGAHLADSGAADTVVADVADVADVVADVADTSAPADTLSDDTVDALADAAEDTRVTPVCPWSDYGEGLKGGAVTWIGFDPRANGLMFAVAGGVLSRSQDSGASWERWSTRDDGFGRLAFPSDDPKGVLGTSGSGLLASSDGGVTFDVRALAGFGLRALMIHPTAPQRMFIGTQGAGIWRSDDHGDSWTPFNVGVPLMEVRSIASPRDQADVVVVGGILLNDNLGFSNDGVLLYSGNGGLSWTVAEGGIGWADDVTFCDDSTVFAAARKSVARSDDGGLTWSLVPGLAGLDVLHIAVASDCETLYAMVYTKGIYRSFDGGDTAEGPFTEGLELEPGRESANRLVIDPSDPTSLFVATYAGLLHSEDSGASWALTDSGNGVAMHTLTVSPAAPARLLGSTWGSGAWQRVDPAAVWERESPAELPRDFVYAIHADPSVADRWFIGTTSELWRTTDAGATYDAVGLQTTNVFDMAFLGSGTILAATQVSGVQRSDDGGDSWVASNTGLTPFATSAGTFIDARHLTLAAGGTLYLGTNGGGLYTSSDSGASWTAITVDQGVSRVAALEVSPGPPEVLYAVVADAGVVRSEDGGVTWTSGGSGLESLDITDLVVDAEGGALYVSTMRNGVFKSLDGEHWAPFDRFCVPVRGFDGLAILEDADGTWLVAVQSGGGVFRDKLR
ncbi:MAG: hypothetical protein CVU56_27165 [Deltaproteobacteria bacterium HGW-Deltaproteobacteria-14]|jgi:hypothetical protein|nr:MAG: hypothetical protein CVU56_27165 [Deltaproteobacteria bacterium HGW-Deltaproteobacteria-14]